MGPLKEIFAGYMSLLCSCYTKTVLVKKTLEVFFYTLLLRKVLHSNHNHNLFSTLKNISMLWNKLYENSIPCIFLLCTTVMHIL